MLFDLPYIAGWSKIGKHRQHQVDQSNTIKTRNRIGFDYIVGTEVVLINDGIYHKAKNKNDCPCLITQLFLEQSRFNT